MLIVMTVANTIVLVLILLAWAYRKPVEEKKSDFETNLTVKSKIFSFSLPHEIHEYFPTWKGKRLATIKDLSEFEDAKEKLNALIKHLDLEYMIETTTTATKPSHYQKRSIFNAGSAGSAGSVDYSAGDVCVGLGTTESPKPKKKRKYTKRKKTTKKK